MSLQTCITEAKAWAKENSELKLNPKEIEEMGRMLQAASDAGATPAEKMKLMQDAVTKRIEMTQAAARGEKYLNAIQNVRNLTNVQKNIELWGDEKLAPDAVEAQITGKSARPGLGVNQDPLAGSRGNMTRYMGFLENALTKQESKLFKALAPGDDLTKKIIQELDAMRSKTELGKSGSDIALSIARKLREAQDAVFKEAQAVNPYLRENQLYLFSRSWNRELVAKVSEEEFIQDMRANYGNNLIGEPEQIKAFLSRTYKEITSGLPPEGADSKPRFWEPQGTSGSQAKQNASSRVFIANNWESEFNSNAKYGDSLYNSFVKQAERQADYVATVNKWGTRAADNFNKFFDDVYRSLKDPDAKELLLKRKADLKEKFEVTQASRYNEAWNIPGRLAQGLIASENLSMLGNHVPRTLSSGPAMLSQIRDGYGMNIFQRATSVAQTFARLMGNFGDAGVSEMKEWGVSSMSVSRDMANQIAAGNGQKLGAVSRLSGLMSKVTLADYFSNAWKFAMAENDTRLLAGFANKSFKDLPAVTQELLQRYGLGDARWEVARHAIKDGRMTPDAFRDVPDEVIHQINNGKPTAGEAMRLRAELAQNLGTLLNDRASMTVGESNSASRAASYGLADINTPQGVARNFFYQFKQASMVRQQLLMRTYRSGGGNTSNISGTLNHMLGMAFMGMVGQQIVEMGAGREPLDVTDPKIIAHMLSSTGMLGYYGDMAADYLSSPEPDQMKRLVQGDFLGPSFGTILKGGEAAFRTGHGVVQYAQGKDRTNQYGGKQWANLLHSLTPGQNLFYAKGALDYHLFNEAHEFLGDQGYVGHLRQQMHQSKNLFGDRQEQYTTFGSDER